MGRVTRAELFHSVVLPPPSCPREDIIDSCRPRCFSPRVPANLHSHSEVAVVTFTHQQHPAVRRNVQTAGRIQIAETEAGFRPRTPIRVARVVAVPKFCLNA